MNAIEQDQNSFDSSGASHLSNPNENVIYAKNYLKTVLKSRLFLGRYLERRLADQRIGYRDVVLVSAAEKELKKDLLEAKHLLQSSCSNTHWIGITDAVDLDLDNTGVCIWTEIDNQPFGHFWFQIRSLKFRDDEIIVMLKCIRHITEAYLEMEPLFSGPNKHSSETNSSQPNTTTDSLNDTYNEILGNLKMVLSISNLKELITFLFAFVIAIFSGTTAFVNFLGNFILALLREASIFIKNSTPLFLGFLDFLSKIVGRFYILLAMFFKPNHPVAHKRTINYSPYAHHSNQYDSRDFD